MPEIELTDKVFVEKRERIRILFPSKIGLPGVLNALREKFDVEEWKTKDKEKIMIFVEEKNLAEKEND